MSETYTVINRMTTSNNSNSTEESMKFSGSALGIAILSVAFLIGFSGNAFIIWTVLTRLKKRTVTCILILHLAIADMMVILTAPIFLHLLATGSWIFGNSICKMCHYIGCLSMYASIFLITFMSIDRFLAVVIPFTSHKIRRKPVVRSIVFAIWVLAFLFSIPMPVYRLVVTINGKQQCITLPSREGGISQHIVFQYIFETTMAFVIPFMVVLFSYIYIAIRLRSAKFQTKHKTSRLVIMIIAAFALFWLPYHVVNIIQVSGELYSSDKLKKVARAGRPNVTALVFLSSSVNPILYVFAGSNFIRTAGLGFMAKLFEASSTEINSLRKVSQVFHQRSRKQSAELGKLAGHAEEQKDILQSKSVSPDS